MNATRRRATFHRYFGSCCFAFVFIWCFQAILFRDEQFGFRDAAHHFYPLHLRVQQEWSAGRIPLWDPSRNGGMPLVGDPTAAVFYPLKVVFFALPFPWASRVYVLLHIAIAYAGMTRLARAWRLGPSAGQIAALSYAFGAPALLLVNNIIYLVGAAWLPWSLGAGRSVCRRPGAARTCGLAVCLALQVLGGDPQSALFAMLLVVGQALYMSNADREPCSVAKHGARLRRFGSLVGGLCIVAALCAIFGPTYREALDESPQAAWIERVGRGSFFFFVLAFTAVRLHRRDRQTLPRLLAVSCAGAIALSLAAIQVLPTAEFTFSTNRTGVVGAIDRYGFSLVPYRVFEAIWPGILGKSYPMNQSWRSLLPPADDPSAWVHSLYIGAIPLVLAIDAIRRGAGRWLGIVLVVALAASMGHYLGPFGISRWLPLPGLPLRDASRLSTAAASFRDGDGSPYSLIAALVPGLDLFRFPSKCLIVAHLACTALAALGWTAQWRNPTPITARIAWRLCAVSVIGLGVFWLAKSPILAHAGDARPSWTTGPFDLAGAIDATTGAWGHGAAAFGVAALIFRANPRSRWTPLALVGALALDLGIAQSPLIWTVSQSAFEAQPAALEAIAAAELREPSTQPFRIHRPSQWHPVGWLKHASPDRLHRMTIWERDSLQPLFGLPLNISYTLSLGALQSDALLRSFRPRLAPADESLAALIGVAADAPIMQFPRTSFDLWNTRYFVLPVEAVDWRDESRGYASFLPNVDLVAPDLKALDRENRTSAWRTEIDWQVLRNRAALPRAWIVHQIRPIPPLNRAAPKNRISDVSDLLASIDPRRSAWVEIEPNQAPLPAIGPLAPNAAESIEITRYDPARVEIEVSMATSGLVVLADAFVAGWRLAIDGERAPVWPTNFGMRGAIVGPGKHTLVYTYEPASFAIGAIVSLATLMAVVAITVFSAIRSRRRPRVR